MGRVLQRVEPRSEKLDHQSLEPRVPEVEEQRWELQELVHELFQRQDLQ